MWNIVAVLLYCVGFGLARIDLSKYFDDSMTAQGGHLTFILVQMCNPKDQTEGLVNRSLPKFGFL